MDTRREFLVVAVAGAAVLVVAPGVDAAPLSAPDPWPLLDPVGPGTSLGLGWTAQSLDPLEQGARRLTLAHDEGGRAEVLVCRRADTPRGVASSQELDFVVVTHGHGPQRTDENLARGLTVLAAAVALRERSTLAAELPSLLTHEERLRRFGDAPAERL